MVDAELKLRKSLPVCVCVTSQSKVYPVPTDGILSFFFCLNEALAHVVLTLVLTLCGLCGGAFAHGS